MKSLIATRSSAYNAICTFLAVPVYLFTQQAALADYVPLVVERGQTVEITAPATNSSLTLHGDMKISLGARAKVYNILESESRAGSPAILIAPDAGDSGRLTITNSAFHSFKPNAMAGGISIGSNGGGSSALLKIENEGQIYTKFIRLERSCSVSSFLVLVDPAPWQLAEITEL